MNHSCDFLLADHLVDDEVDLYHCLSHARNITHFGEFLSHLRAQAFDFCLQNILGDGIYAADSIPTARPRTARSRTMQSG